MKGDTRYHHNLLVIEDETTRDKRRLVVREHRLQEQQIPVTIKKTEGDYDVLVNGDPVDKRLTMLWLFEEDSPGSGKFVQSLDKVLPQMWFDEQSNLDTFWQREKIDKATVTASLR